MRRASLAARPLLDVPIYLAALNDGMLRLAARAGDGVILNFVSPRQVKRAVELVRAVRSEAGLTSPFEVTVFFRATVVDNPSAALARYQQELLTYLLAPVYQRFFTADGWGELSQSTATLWERGEREAALAGVPMEFIHERALVGSAASISGQLDEYAAAGMDTAFVLAVPLPGSDFQSVSAEIRPRHRRRNCRRPLTLRCSPALESGPELQRARPEARRLRRHAVSRSPPIRRPAGGCRAGRSSPRSGSATAARPGPARSRCAR